MRKIISLFLAALLSVAFCTSAFAVSPDDLDEPISSPLDNETPIFPVSESENYPEEQGFLPNGVQLIPVNGPATQGNISPNMLYSQRSEGPSVYGILTEANEPAAYKLEIDFDVIPEVLIGFYRYHTSNDFSVQIRDESTQRTTTSNMANGTNPYLSRVYYKISKTEGGTHSYTISFTSSLPDTGYAFIVSTPERFAEDFSGKESAVSVAKSEPLREYGTFNYMKGCAALLNGDGEWFHYIADGETFITAGITNWSNLQFIVYDPETNKAVYKTTPDDHVKETYSTSLYEEFVQKRLDLVPGKEYLIKFYSTTYKSAEFTDTYNIWIGSPCVKLRQITYVSSAFSVPANVTRTFTFQLSGYPKSYRLDSNTTFYVTGDYKNVDARITSCQITAPNGFTFLAPMGNKIGLSKIELDNYLTNPSNVPVNGTWKVTVRASQAISDLRFRFTRGSGIVGNDGN